MHEVFPEMGAKYPAAHETHVVAPVIDTDVPGLQAEHTALAVALEYEPVAQGAQAVEETYVPGPQGMTPGCIAIWR